ncbi:NAD(P)H-dependent oxidoreductase [Steroidobacter sp. S1-65]|uniref:NAD(P)H-dependent oxidoreductase n=1 Tax=Steroidobacter gossypii TaxID=2805490 RepID=A0ABS1X4L5_9GAMM|nr:NAD(P)H-dependent oxidoreductase [Steroidobacter gossypii]MBM0108147.1 NAD(P)H-dependent oxidoreductase [Steroidobacter gossypii]
MPTSQDKRAVHVPEPRKLGVSAQVDKQTFVTRFHQRFYDPAFDASRAQIDALAEIAWQAYQEGRKAPRTRAAGPEFENPEYQLSEQWLQAREEIRRAQQLHDDDSGPPRVLLISGAARHEQTCPGEVSKSYRLCQLAEQTLVAEHALVDLLDLSHLSAEYGRVIYPCKSCVATAMPLCHWPCSCYPNHALGQVNDWMNEIYPRWVAAHAVMIVSPVYWYQAPAALKLMIDRLVCADGGNPDPTRTDGKDARKAKAIELEGWSYPRHLQGRAFSVIVHGDTVGAETLRRNLHDWLCDMQLVPAGGDANIDRYIGYYEPYATSHEALDSDQAIQQEVRNAARHLLATVSRLRARALRESVPPSARPK